MFVSDDIYILPLTYWDMDFVMREGEHRESTELWDRHFLCLHAKSRKRKKKMRRVLIFNLLSELLTHRSVLA